MKQRSDVIGGKEEGSPLINQETLKNDGGFFRKGIQKKFQNGRYFFIVFFQEKAKTGNPN